MDPNSNERIAQLLRNVATACILHNENRFKIIAYQQAADIVENLTQSLYNLWSRDQLQKVDEIGQTISHNLDEYFRTGSSEHFQEMVKDIPQTVFTLTAISGIGPKRAYALVTNLELYNNQTVLEDLLDAASRNEIATMDGYGEKSQQQIVENVQIFQKQGEVSKRILLPFAHTVAQSIIEHLSQNPHVIACEILGSLRRNVSTIGDIDIAVTALEYNFETILTHFTHYPHTLRIDNIGKKKASIITPPNIRVDVRLTTKQTHGSMLQYFTGSKKHNIQLREHCLKQSMSLSEYGITDKKNKKVYTFETEKELYSFTHLDYISPYLREGTDEIERAKNHTLPTLVSSNDIKGDLHIHSNFDIKTSHDIGVNSFLQLAQKAQFLNYDYIGFTEHNPRRKEPPEQVVAFLRTRKRRAQKELTQTHVRYFLGLEVDIRPDGTLALHPDAFSELDYLVVSIHSSFRIDTQTSTKRVLRALNNPKVKIFGHPTGRVLEQRNGIELNWDPIFKLCKVRNIALEINSSPNRLDLPDTLVQKAISNGVQCIINTDAHAVDHMDNMHYGVSVAQRGWCEKKDIVNTLPESRFREWILS